MTGSRSVGEGGPASARVLVDARAPLDRPGHDVQVPPLGSLPERLRNLDGVLEMLPHKQSLAHKLRTDGLPHNWRHVNVGVSHREEQQWWGTTASWRSRAPQKGARLTHQKNAYATMRFNSSGAVRLRPLTAIMREFGHTSVDIIKLDVVRTAPSGSRPGCEVE